MNWKTFCEKTHTSVEKCDDCGKESRVCIHAGDVCKHCGGYIDPCYNDD